MLTGLLGIHLILKIGKSQPTRAPYNVMTALKHVQVTNDAKGADGFQMTFSLGKDKMGEYTLWESGLLDPETRVQIGAIIGLSTAPIIDGLIDHHQVKASSQPGQSTLTVSGSDISVKMNLKDKGVPYPAQSDSGIVEQILNKYATFKITPAVTKTKEYPSVQQRTPHQTNLSDLDYIKDLAERNGFVFYIEPDSLGENIAYWGPEKREGIAQPPLNVNMASATNVLSLDFTHDALSPINVSGHRLDPETKKSIPVDGKAERNPPYAKTEGKAIKEVVMKCLANKDPGVADTLAKAKATNAPQPVSATGSLDTVRYGGLLRARKSVTVSGAGRRNDGKYIVSSVTHEIEPGKYTQQFTLTREGNDPKGM